MMLFLLALTTVALTQASCPYGSSFNSKTGSCYLVSKLKASWTPANGICKNLGGSLAVVNTAAENDFISQLVSKALVGDVFLGIKRVDGMLVNIDNKPAEYINFLKNPGNPDGTPVVSMIGDIKNILNMGKWQYSRDATNVVQAFVCEIPACTDNVPAPSKLKAPWFFQPRVNADGLYYSLFSHNWFYGNPASGSGVPQAKAACESVGGHLPLIDNLLENLEVVGVAKNVYNLEQAVPIGYGSDLKGVWSWDDHDTERDYTNWVPKALTQLANVTIPLTPENQRAVLLIDSIELPAALNLPIGAVPLTTFWFSTLQQDVTNLIAKGFVCEIHDSPATTCK